MTPPPPPEKFSVLSGGDCSSQRSAAEVCSNYVGILLIDIGLSDPRVNKRRIVIFLSRKFCPKHRRMELSLAGLSLASHEGLSL
eukprot:scaffold14029_cov44-Skeletonema_dohrnii-CCMP3373.AAC.1